MKLKKIASLALAGIMAVSMLAGCNGNPTDPETPTDPTTPTTGVVAAVNNGQSAANKVKVTFTASSDLTDMVEAAVRQNGIAMNDNSLRSVIVSMTGETYENTATYTFANSKRVNNTGLNNTEHVALFAVAPVNTTSNVKPLTESAALKMVADIVDAEVAKLVETQNMSGVGLNDKYYTYSYTGEISDLVSATGTDGTTSYFVAYTITQTITEKTLEA